MAQERVDASIIPVQAEYRRVETVRATQMQQPFFIPANLSVHGADDVGEANDWLVVNQQGRRYVLTDMTFRRSFTKA